MSTVGGFLARYPEFADIPVERIDAFLEDAQSETSRRVWGKLFERGVYALAAHLLFSAGTATDSQSAGQPLGTVQSHAAGGLSESFAVAKSGTEGDALFDTSRYGQEYVRLRKLVSPHILVTK